MTDLKLTIEADEEGLPPDAVLLSSADGTFGVRRKDTLEVIVADGTAMVQDATNLNLWTYTIVGAIVGVTYEWVAEIQFPASTHHVEDEATPADLTTSCDAMLTIAQVDALLAIHVPSADLTDWTGLSNADKSVYICRAQNMIDAGTWKGVKWDSEQSFSFPRKDADGVLIGVANEADPDNPLAPLPVREALALLSHSFVHRSDLWERHEGQAMGLVSHSAGGIAKAYTPRHGRLEAQHALRTVTDVWLRLERFWRRGGAIV